MTAPLPAVLIFWGKQQPPAANFYYGALARGQYVCPYHQRLMKPGGYSTEKGVARVKFECGCRVTGPVVDKVVKQ